MIAGFNAVVTAGIGEEWIFRVLLPIEFYAATQSIAVGALVPLVIFAAFHYDQNWRGVGNAAVFGLAATIVYVVSTNVWLVIAMHSIANLIAVVVVPEFQLRRIRTVARRAIAPIDNDSGVTLAAQQSHPLP
jgi:membrane protease YdiL (CAAX protease family)